VNCNCMHRARRLLLLLIWCFASGPLLAQMPFYTDNADVTDRGTLHFESFNEYDGLQSAQFPDLRQNTANFKFNYGFPHRLEFDVDFPYLSIYRAPGSQASLGFGDTDTGIKWNFYKSKHPLSVPDLSASFYVEFPTGDSSRLKEEFHEVEIPGAPENAIHGHDLTLGTGSYDGIFGVQSSLRYKNFFAEANGQFTLRGDGTHDYHFANDLTWNAGPGYYLVRKRETLVGCQCAVSGESKDVDRFQGRAAEDTGVTSVFVGPRIIVSHDQISGELAAEFPVLMNTTALQAVPDYRLRASVAVSW